MPAYRPATVPTRTKPGPSRLWSRARAALLAAGIAAGVGPPSLVAERLDLAKLDLCARISGTAIAAAVGATLRSTRAMNESDGSLARCIYSVRAQGVGEFVEKVFVVEAYAADHFSEIRPYVEAPTRDIAGLGDAAWVYRDPDSHDRLRLYVVRAGVVTLDVTGEDEDEVRAIAGLAIAKF